MLSFKTDQTRKRKSSSLKDILSYCEPVCSQRLVSPYCHDGTMFLPGELRGELLLDLDLSKVKLKTS